VFLKIILNFICSMQSLSLAYKELSIETKKRDDQLKNLDPKKKEQMERLGMGGAGSRYVAAIKLRSLILIIILKW
jgi:hypothetical protein